MVSKEHTVRRTVESVARDSYGRLIAYLASRTRDVASAEDALSDALVSALTTWPRDGIPGNPHAWLLTAARNRLVDQARRRQVRAESEPTLELLASRDLDTSEIEAIPDERLRLLFVCAHPAIDPDMHTPLMLQTVLGLDATQIGRAFLVSSQTMSQRLVRAKTKIRRAGIAFEIPPTRDLPERLDAVLNAIYAAYGSGWEDAAGVDPRARGLAEEAIWLGRALSVLMPHEPEVLGLLALMFHCEARRSARRGADGDYIPLTEQDTSQWDAALVAEAERLLASAATFSRIGRFQIEAAIQSVHAERVRTGQTDWTVIDVFHAQLVQLSPTLGARIAHAASHAEVAGAAAGLAMLDALDQGSTKSYQPYWAVRAHLLERLGRDASEALDRAIGLTEDDAVRRFLLRLS